MNNPLLCTAATTWERTRYTWDGPIPREEQYLDPCPVTRSEEHRCVGPAGHDDTPNPTKHMCRCLLFWGGGDPHCMCHRLAPAACPVHGKQPHERTVAGVVAAARTTTT